MIALLVVILSVGGVLTNQTSSNCGQQGNITNTLVDGEEVQDGELPWNINIYRQHRYGLKYLCAGTLVTPTHVMTTVMCVFDSDISNEVYPASELAIAARKLHQDFDTNEPDSQWRAVTSVIPHEEFNYTSFVHDIAILVANQSFAFSSHVTVACLDWSTQIPSPSYTDVLIAAAERQSSTNRDHILVAAERHRLVDQDNCLASALTEYRQHVTADKYCGRPVGNDACDDATGGGLMLQQDGRHYLWGIRVYCIGYTANDRCYSDRLNSYMNITQHLAWIRRHLPSTQLN